MTAGKSGRHTIICGGMSDVYLTVDWAELVDSAANTSVLTVTGLQMNAGVWAGRYYINGTISVNGTVIARLQNNAHQAYISTTGTPAYEANGAYPFRSGAITHNADGTGGAVLSVNLSGSNQTGGQHYYASAEIPITLTSIPRLSTVSCGGGEIGSPVQITIASQATSFLHRLSYVFGDAEGEIGTDLAVGSISWTPPMELCSQIPHAEWGRATILCQTYHGENLVGSSQCQVRLTVPKSVGIRVTEDWVRLVPVQTGGAEAMDCWIQGKSRVSAELNESGISYENAYGSEVFFTTITVEGDVYMGSEHSHVLRGSGTLQVTCKAVDTRGREDALVREITVLPYGAPVLKDVEVFRCDELGQANSEGTCVSCKAACAVSDLDGHNSVQIRAYLVPVGGSPGEGVLLEEGVAHVLWVGLVSSEQSYEVRLEAVDSLGVCSAVTVTVPTAKLFFHGRAGGNGGAFGKYAEEDDLLEVAWSLKTKGNLVVEGMATVGGKTLQDWLYPVGAVCLFGEDVQPDALYGGQWTAAETDQMRAYVRIS